MNLLSGDADAAAFDDVDVDMYLDLVSGEANSIGAVYKAKDDAEAPVDSVRGKEFTIIAHHAGAELAHLLQRGSHLRRRPHEDHRLLLLR